MTHPQSESSLGQELHRKELELQALTDEIESIQKTKHALEVSAAQWQDTFDAIADAICVLDSEQRILRSNRAMCNLLGAPEEKLLGRKCCQVVHGTGHAPSFCPCREVLGSGRRKKIVLEYARRWFEVTVDPRFDAGGVLQGYIHVMSDVSQAVRKENDLREAHHTLLTVLDSIEAVIFAADLQTHDVIFMNRHMRELFHDDLVSPSFWDTFYEQEDAVPCVGRRRLLDEQGNPTGVFVWEAGRSIKGRWFLHHDRAVRWVDGRYVRLHVATDISAVKSLEQERIQNETRMRQAQKMEAIGTLAGGIAHDFNNILSAILGYAELALDDANCGRAAPAYIQQILRAGHRARDLVQQILTFSRQTETEAKPIQVQPIIKEAVKLLRASLPSTIDIQVTAESEALVLADPIQIHQVIMNLCTNAGHAMRHRGGVLSVLLTEKTLGSDFTGQYAGMQPGRYLILRVSDTGHGIEPSVIERIFDPYFSTKKKEEGTGMGLAVVEGIVRSCGGTVAVESSPGQGATFQVCLPVIRQGDVQGAVPPETAPMGCERILVVDDEAPLAELAQEMLSRLGYRVTIRTSSIQALSLFERHPNDFDLVITDYTMPHITGEMLAEKLKAIRPEIPIVICTGYSQTVTQQSMQQLGIDALMMKPLVRSHLAATIRQVLDGR